MQVYTKTDESDTGFIRAGTEAAFQVDALPNEIFHGRVSAVRLNSYTVQNVVTYDTIIDFENPDEKLLPGETAYVTIPTGHADNALGVPNAAMTFVPPLPSPELEAIYKRHHIPVSSYASHVNGHQVVWKSLENDRIEPVDIRVGISDYTVSQLLEGDVREGDRLVTATETAGGGSPAGRAPLPGRAPARR